MCGDPGTGLEWKQVQQRAGGAAYRTADLESGSLAASPTSALLCSISEKKIKMWCFCREVVVGIK